MSLENLQISIDSGPVEKGISLTSLMELVAARIKTIPSSWVVAEIAQIKHSRHLYLELVEHDENHNEVAKCRGVVWGSQATGILKRFEAATGGTVTAGMKVLVLGRASFHPQYGFSMSIEDIDPSFTLGDMQKKLLNIRAKLKSLLLYDRNKGLNRPQDYTRVAVIAPQDAAGLGDFMATVEALDKFDLCTFHYYHATFQGTNTVPSFLQALKDLKRDVWAYDEVNFDALVVIRGGGAVTDLAYLNELEIAKALVEMDIPLLTGIGHQRDNCILDEVAMIRFDTPSKVAAHLMETIVDNAKQAENNWNFIWSYWQLSSERMAKELRDLEESIRTRATATVTKSRSEADLLCQQLIHLASSTIETARKDTLEKLESIKDMAQRTVDQAKRDTRSAMEFVVGMGPLSTLKRGFAIVRGRGGFVTSAATARDTEAIEIEFHDGKIEINNTKGQ